MVALTASQTQLSLGLFLVRASAMPRQGEIRDRPKAKRHQHGNTDWFVPSLVIEVKLCVAVSWEEGPFSFSPFVIPTSIFPPTTDLRSTTGFTTAYSLQPSEQNRTEHPHKPVATGQSEVRTTYGLLLEVRSPTILPFSRMNEMTASSGLTDETAYRTTNRQRPSKKKTGVKRP